MFSYKLYVKNEKVQQKDIMKRLFRYLKDYRKECVAAPLFKLLEACFELSVPLVVASVIDRGILAHDTGHIYRMFALLLALGAVGFVCAVTAQYFSARAAVGFSARVRSALFSHVQSLPAPDLDRIGISQLITRITSDVTQAQTGVNLTLRLIMRAPFVVFGAVIMAFTVDARCALIFCVCVPLLTVTVFAIMLGCVPLYRRVQTHLEQVSLRVRENLVGARVLRAFAREDAERERFDRENDALCAVQRFTGRISALLNPLTVLIVNLSIAALIGRGAVRVGMGALSQGQVVALYNYMMQILTELIKMANLIITMTRATASAGRIAEVLAVEPSMQGGSLRGTDDYDIRFENVSFTYRDAAAPALEGVSFTACKGQTIGIIGATGSGKSTLVQLISRFYDATEGRVTLGGRDIREYDFAFLRKKIAVVPQRAVLFRGSIRENVCAGIPADDTRVMAAIERAQAVDIVKGKERGLDEPVEQGGKNFSGGQRQRLTIARALVREPEILILDDSSSALDYATDAALRRQIRACPFRPTTFVVSQRACSVMHADQIIVLENGAVVGLGSHQQLLEHCPTYAEIYASQFEEVQA